jgi:hypothetical protein
MPVERRLREGLHRNADALDPDVDAFLATVVHRGGRRMFARRTVWAAMVAAAVASAVVLGPRVVDAIRTSKLGLPATTPSVTMTPPQGLAGTFTGRLRPGLEAVRVDRMAGTWTIGMHPDGTITVQGPPTFNGVLGGYRFQPRGSLFRTDLFEHDACKGFPRGTYRWSGSGSALTFTVSRDPCDARVALLTSTPLSEASPLDGEWHMRYTCEEELRTFQRNIQMDRTRSVLSDGRSREVLLKVWSRELAWGPSALAATELTPKALCQGAPVREHVMRIDRGFVSEDPHTIGLLGAIRFVNDNTIAISDPYGNIDTVDTFTFRLHGDTLTLTQTGLHDSWQGTWLEEAPWHRVN